MSTQPTGETLAQLCLPGCSHAVEQSCPGLNLRTLHAIDLSDLLEELSPKIGVPPAHAGIRSKPIRWLVDHVALWLSQGSKLPEARETMGTLEAPGPRGAQPCTPAQSFAPFQS